VGQNVSKHTVAGWTANPPPPIHWAGQGSICSNCSYIFNRFSMRGLLIAMKMKATNTFETSANFYKTTRCNILEESHFQTLRRSKSLTQLSPPDSRQELISLNKVTSLFYAGILVSYREKPCCAWREGTQFQLGAGELQFLSTL
jgi:hypothetical protein